MERAKKQNNVKMERGSWVFTCGTIGRKALVTALLATTALPVGIASSMSEAAAQEAAQANFNVPAGSLSRALSAFGVQSGTQVSYEAAIITGKNSGGFNGAATREQALAHLLKGSGLSFTFTGPTNVEITGHVAAADGEQAQNESGTILDAVVIKGTGNAGSAVYSEPRSSVYISGAELERFGRISAADSLKGQPGVQVGDSRNGGGLDVNIRGIQGQSRVAVAVDGSHQALNVYRGYAGTQQRSYLDPDMISSVVINKGPQLGASSTGAIGGTVNMTTLRPEDVLLPGKKIGVRLKGELWDNGVKPPYRAKSLANNANTESDLLVEPTKTRGNLLNSDAKSGSAAFAFTSDHLDGVAAYSRRSQGNYFAGTKGREKYRIFDKYGDENNSVAKSYAEGEEVLNSSANTESALMKATIKPTDAHALELSYRFFNGQFGEIMPSDIYRYGRGGIYQYPAGDIRINSGSARYSFNPQENDLVDFKANLWLTDAKSSQLNGVTGPKSQDFITDRSWVRMDNFRIGGDISNRSQFSNDLGQFTLDLGGSFENEDIRPQDSVVITEHDLNSNRLLRNGYRSETSLSAKLEYRPRNKLMLWAGGRYGQFRSDDRNAVSTARREDVYGRWITVRKKNDYGNLYWRPDENGQFTDATDPRLHNGIVFKDSNNPLEGVPYNDFGATSTQVSAPSTTSTVVGFDRGKPLSARDTGFSPAFGVKYEIIPETFLYTSYTEGYRMPSLFENTLGTQQVRTFSGLKPERSRSIEIGASTTRDNLILTGDTTSFKIAYFDTSIKDYIVRYYFPAGLGLMQFSNAESYKINGLEFQSNYDSGRFFADFSASYHFRTETCDADFAARLREPPVSIWMKTGSTPDCTPGSFMGSYTNTQNPPKYSTSLTLGSRFLEERLVVGGRMTYTSGPTEELNEPWQLGATTPQLVYHPVTVLDAFVNYKLNEGAMLNASVSNITDRYYTDPLAQSFMPAPGRTFRVSLTVRF